MYASAELTAIPPGFTIPQKLFGREPGDQLEKLIVHLLRPAVFAGRCIVNGGQQEVFPGHTLGSPGNRTLIGYLWHYRSVVCSFANFGDQETVRRQPIMPGTGLDLFKVTGPWVSNICTSWFLP
jgi:hypothetical protein